MSDAHKRITIRDQQRARPGRHFFVEAQKFSSGAVSKTDAQSLTSDDAAAPNASTGPVLLRVCAWCQTFMGVTAAEGITKTEITHGMCPECQVKWNKDIEDQRKEGK